MKIENCNLQRPQNVNAKDIMVDTVFFGKILDESIYLRAFNIIIDLKNPRKTWEISGTKTDLVVEYYVPVHAKLVVEGPL